MQSAISIIPFNKKEIKSLVIDYSFHETDYGLALIASTYKGICYIAFGESEKMEKELKQRYKKFDFIQKTTHLHETARKLLSNPKQEYPLPIHITGTDFQLKVWNALLQIPVGGTTTYKAIAQEIKHPKAVRAVGTAVGKNPVSYFIPCHRVIKTDGKFGGYHWGLELKKQLLEKESKI